MAFLLEKLKIIKVTTEHLFKQLFDETLLHINNNINDDDMTVWKTVDISTHIRSMLNVVDWIINSRKQDFLRLHTLRKSMCSDAKSPPPHLQL